MFDKSNATGEMREPAKSTCMFTNILDGLLDADEENPLLKMFTVNVGEAEQQSAKHELGTTEYTRRNKNMEKKLTGSGCGTHGRRGVCSGGRCEEFGSLMRFSTNRIEDGIEHGRWCNQNLESV